MSRTQPTEIARSFVYLLWCPKGQFVYATREISTRYQGYIFNRAGLLIPEIVVILFTRGLPYVRRIKNRLTCENYVANYKIFQEHRLNSRRFPGIPWVADTLTSYRSPVRRRRVGPLRQRHFWRQSRPSTERTRSRDASRLRSRRRIARTSPARPPCAAEQCWGCRRILATEPIPGPCCSSRYLSCPSLYSTSADTMRYTYDGVVTSQYLWSRYVRHFVGVTCVQLTGEDLRN